MALLTASPNQAPDMSERCGSWGGQRSPAAQRSGLFPVLATTFLSSDRVVPLVVLPPPRGASLTLRSGEQKLPGIALVRRAFYNAGRCRSWCVESPPLSMPENVPDQWLSGLPCFGNDFTPIGFFTQPMAGAAPRDSWYPLEGPGYYNGDHSGRCGPLA